MGTLTNNRADYVCPRCDSRQLAFLSIVLNGRLRFLCKCGQEFEVDDAEGKYLHPKLASLRERYPH